MTDSIFNLIVAVALLAAAQMVLTVTLAMIERSNAKRWRLLMTRLYGVPKEDRADIAQIIDSAVDASLAKRLPTAEQFEASVKAIVTAREAAKQNRGNSVESRT